MLQVNNLYKSFHNNLILENINLSFEEHKIYGLIGINGAGKSTLLRSIVGVYNLDKGEVLLDDENIYENIKAKKEIFYVPDENPYFNVKTVMNLIEFYETIYGEKDEEIFNKMRKLFTLDINAPISSFSKGMKKQGFLFATLCFKPKYLLLDETFEGIDPVIRVKMKKFLMEYVEDENTTIIITSHNINDLDSLCDQIIMLKDKNVYEKAFDKREELFKIQCAFKDDISIISSNTVNILKETKIGSVHHYEVTGEIEEINKFFQMHNPIIYDVIPFTTEEIFIFNAEEGNYEA